MKKIFLLLIVIVLGILAYVFFLNNESEEILKLDNNQEIPLPPPLPTE